MILSFFFFFLLSSFFFYSFPCSVLSLGIDRVSSFLVHDRDKGILMIRSVTLILGCCLVLILRKGEWNELTGHSKDRGEDRPNSRTNSLQCGENDADQILFEDFLVLPSILRLSAHLRSIASLIAFDRTCSRTLY
jgi:hypothetical protein